MKNTYDIELNDFKFVSLYFHFNTSEKIFNSNHFIIFTQNLIRCNNSVLKLINFIRCDN